MNFSLGYSPWLLGLCILVAGGLTYWTYRRTYPPLSPGWRGVLGSLRFGALALICFLLFEPVLQQIQESERPPLLAVLIDDSESLRVVSAGGEDPSADAAQQAVQPVVQSLDDSQTPGAPRFFAFDQSLRSLSSSSEADSLGFEGARTDLSAALQAVRNEFQGENLRGVVLVSDGQYNTGRNPLRVADRYPVPIHTVTVGDTTRQRDVQLRRVATNDRAYLDSEVPVRANLTVEGGEGETVTVSLEQDGTVLDATDVQLPQGTADVPVDLTYRPQEVGLQQLTVRATSIPGEATTRNNAQTASLRVLESKRRILLLGAAPSPNFTTIRRVFERDADTEVVARVPQQDGQFYEGPLPDDLSDIDVVVNAGFPSDVVPQEITSRIASLIEEDTPALFFLDRQTDLGAWRNHFASFLPAVPEAANVSFAERPFTLNEGAQQHPVFQIEDADLSLFQQLPPLQVSDATWSPAPDANVMATASGPAGAASEPLLVLRRRAGHRTAAFLGAGLWRWSLLPADLEAAQPLWPGLASNLLRWAGTQDEEQPVQVQPVASTFDGGEPVEFTGQVYDESMTPVSDASVEVTIIDSAGTENPYPLEPLGNGRYTLDVGPLPEGNYQYEAVATRDGAELGTDQGQFSVEALQLEYQAPRADAVTMRQIATRSGGQAYTSQTVEQLPDDLANTPDYSADVVEETSEAELWRTSLFLLLIVGLLAIEWGLRKRFGLT